MLKNIAVVLTFCVLSTVACIKSQVETNAANSAAATANSNVESPKSESVVEKNTDKLIAKNPNEKVFRGMINGTSFEMHLVREGGKLLGTYFYTKVGKNLNLTGTIDASGNFKLQETDPAGKKTGEWAGTWKEETNSNGIALEGNWKKPSDSNDASFSFYATEQIIEFTGNIKFVDKTIKEDNKAKRSTITSVYPELTSADSAATAKFNAVVKKIVTDGNDSYKKDVAEMSAEDIKSLGKEFPDLSNEIGYDVALANNDFVSLIISDYSYLGGAHGGTSYTSLNYDLKNNKELKLEDIFEPNSNYLKTLSDYSIADLKPRVGEMSDDEWIRKGTAPDAENYQVWNLTKKGLMITFGQYQVAAYAAGPQTVIIPYSKLQSILRKDGITAQIAK